MRTTRTAALVALWLAATCLGEPPSEPVTWSLADAPKVERQTLGRLVYGDSWPRRALAAMRLERYSCDESREMLDSLLDDESWQVRAFANRAISLTAFTHRLAASGMRCDCFAVRWLRCRVNRNGGSGSRTLKRNWPPLRISRTL